MIDERLARARRELVRARDALASARDAVRPSVIDEHDAFAISELRDNIERAEHFASDALWTMRDAGDE